jgi:hypothetical protein
MSIVSLIKGMSGKNTFVIDSTNWVNKAILRSGSISEEALNSLDGPILLNWFT